MQPNDFRQKDSDAYISLQGKSEIMRLLKRSLDTANDVRRSVDLVYQDSPDSRELFGSIVTSLLNIIELLERWIVDFKSDFDRYTKIYKTSKTKKEIRSVLGNLHNRINVIDHYIDNLEEYITIPKVPGMLSSIRMFRSTLTNLEKILRAEYNNPPKKV